jgi:hypothetical protein
VKWKCEGPLLEQILKHPKFLHLDEVLYKQFTAMHSEGKTMNQPVIIEKSKLFNNEMKITEGHIP